MAGSLYTNGKSYLLSKMLRTDVLGTSVGYLYLQTSSGTVLRYRNLGTSGADFGSVSSNQISMTGLPLSTTHSSNGTIAKAKFLDNTQAQDVIIEMECGETVPKEMRISDEVISAGEASNITAFTMLWVESLGTVKLNSALRTRLLESLTNKNTAAFSAAGTIKVYSGSAPASADDAATGTELISFTTSTTSWNVASGSATLASSLNANASAGSETAVGYARFSWTSGSTFVIQGSIGTSGTDFIIDDATLTSGNSYNLTAATFTF